MSGELLIAYSLKATVILIAALGLCFILRRASAAARHLLWTVAFAALLLLPVLSRITPGWTAPVGPSSASRIAPARPVRVIAPPSTASMPARAPIDWIPLVWMLGATLVLARFGVGTALVWLKTRRSPPMQIAGRSDRVRVLDAGPGAMPMTWGVFRPVVLLPTEAAAWPAERLRVVLLHELAHVSRQDWLTLAMAEVAVSLYWFHPLAWWAASRMRFERERACDDRVLAAGIAASGYAADLLEVARGVGGAGDNLLAAPAMARASNLESRLRAILDPKIRRRVVSAKAAAIGSAAAMLALLPLASVHLKGQAGGLTGTIYDISGGAVPGAKVLVVNADTGFSQTIVSGPDGSYSLPDLAAGRYQVKVAQPGFALFLRESVAVPAVLDVVLSLGQVMESMVISGKRTQAAPNPGPRRVRVGGNVQAAKLLEGPRPAYPPHAEAAGIQGKVLLQAVIRLDGAIGGLSVLSSRDPELAAAALESVRQWRYQPTLLNGQPVEVITTISVDFRLDQ
jgi:TonB family protein